ncbi:hypothetical protein QCA50_007170 [Cerrena zonata]|uniref:MARVEL domain-containing protein n=1 Tax=Cerrena zonata TaxID=2478898 RepID=A0AAW0G6U7_9APHY
MGLSPAGKRKLAAQLFLVLIDIIVLAFATRINLFQEFYYMADVFPFALSIVTLSILIIMMLLEYGISNSFTAKPPFEIGMLYILSIFWLAFNVFSTTRWRHVPMSCSSIPSDYPDMRSWCQDVQALKSLVWIHFVALFFTASFTLRYVLVQHNRGNRLIWKTPISQYNPRAMSEFITDDTSFQWVSAGSDPNARRTGDWAAFEKI